MKIIDRMYQYDDWFEKIKSVTPVPANDNHS